MQSARNVFKFYSGLQRCYSSKPVRILEQLRSRSLIKVSGDESAGLLQGLITNDMQHLSHKAGSMFAMFLNNKGRVLYDTIIYRASLDNVYYLEVDSEARDLVKKHLSVYRLRRKIDITSIDDQYQLWVKFDPNVASRGVESTILEAPRSDTVVIKEIDGQNILIFKDPRLGALGSRILTPVGFEKIPELFEGVKGPSYKWLRYNLGVGEGVNELPSGNCFPLEANCDYLHGVSFHKGCYIGQELTARTHHTGVIRKRLMPLLLKTSFQANPQKDEPVKADDTNVGKLRGFEESTALALLRIHKVLNATLVVNNTEATSYKPTWWPQEVSKERVSSGSL